MSTTLENSTFWVRAITQIPSFYRLGDEQVPCRRKPFYISLDDLLDSRLIPVLNTGRYSDSLNRCWTRFMALGNWVSEHIQSYYCTSSARNILALELKHRTQLQYTILSLAESTIRFPNNLYVTRRSSRDVSSTL